jgi:hypothetical protein
MNWNSSRALMLNCKVTQQYMLLVRFWAPVSILAASWSHFFAFACADCSAWFEAVICFCAAASAAFAVLSLLVTEASPEDA